MLSLVLPDAIGENTQAFSAVCVWCYRDTESHLYRSGTSLTGTRQWCQVPSDLFPCVLVALGPHREPCLGAWAASLTTLSWTFADFPYLSLISTFVQCGCGEEQMAWYRGYTEHVKHTEASVDWVCSPTVGSTPLPAHKAP